MKNMQQKEDSINQSMNELNDKARKLLGNMSTAKPFDDQGINFEGSTTKRFKRDQFWSQHSNPFRKPEQTVDSDTKVKSLTLGESDPSENTWASYLTTENAYTAASAVAITGLLAYATGINVATATPALLRAKQYLGDLLPQLMSSGGNAVVRANQGAAGVRKAMGLIGSAIQYEIMNTPARGGRMFKTFSESMNFTPSPIRRGPFRLPGAATPGVDLSYPPGEESSIVDSKDSNVLGTPSRELAQDFKNILGFDERTLNIDDDDGLMSRMDLESQVSPRADSKDSTLSDMDLTEREAYQIRNDWGKHSDSVEDLSPIRPSRRFSMDIMADDPRDSQIVPVHADAYPMVKAANAEENSVLSGIMGHLISLKNAVFMNPVAVQGTSLQRMAQNRAISNMIDSFVTPGARALSIPRQFTRTVALNAGQYPVAQNANQYKGDVVIDIRPEQASLSDTKRLKYEPTSIKRKFEETSESQMEESSEPIPDPPRGSSFRVQLDTAIMKSLQKKTLNKVLPDLPTYKSASYARKLADPFRRSSVLKLDREEQKLLRTTDLDIKNLAKFLWRDYSKKHFAGNITRRQTKKTFFKGGFQSYVASVPGGLRVIVKTWPDIAPVISLIMKEEPRLSNFIIRKFNDAIIEKAAGG
jgi:hypothetical protein